MRSSHRLHALGIGAIALSTFLPGGVANAESANQAGQTRSLQDGHVITDSKAKLHRKADRIAVKVATTELDPHEQLDLLWAVFDNSAGCVHGNPVTGSPCGPADLFVDATQASLHFVARLAAAPDGSLGYEASLGVGDTSGCVPDFPCGDGLTNPLGAEIHSVLFTEAGGRQGAQFLP